jgi:hypothetical protein
MTSIWCHQILYNEDRDGSRNVTFYGDLTLPIVLEDFTEFSRRESYKS